MKVWLAGTIWIEDEEDKGFTLIGIFDSKELAKKACTKENDFIAPWLLNTADISNEITNFEDDEDWPFDETC